MEKRKITLDENIVKYIFPGVSPTIALGEDGYIIYDFKSLYPKKLAIFIPIEIERSNYSDVFPKSFEAYFRNVDAEIAHLMRMMEINLENRLQGLGVEYIPGQILRRPREEYTVFRFDELIEPRDKTAALCRARFRKLSISDRTQINNLNPYFQSFASSLDGREYLYWIMPISDFFLDVNKVLTESVFAMV